MSPSSHRRPREEIIKMPSHEPVMQSIDDWVRTNRRLLVKIEPIPNTQLVVTDDSAICKG